MRSVVRRRLSDRRQPGPLRKPATVMKQTMPLSFFASWSKTFQVAQRQK